MTESRDELEQIKNIERVVAIWVMAREHVRKAYNDLEHAQALLHSIILSDTDTVGAAAYRRARTASLLLDNKIMCHMPYLETKMDSELFGLNKTK